MGLIHSTEELKGWPEEKLSTVDKARVALGNVIEDPKYLIRGDPIPTIIFGPPILLVGAVAELASRGIREVLGD